MYSLMKIKLVLVQIWGLIMWMKLRQKIYKYIYLQLRMTSRADGKDNIHAPLNTTWCKRNMIDPKSKFFGVVKKISSVLG